MVSTKEITFIIFGLTFLAMIWYITNRGRANLARAKEDSQPAIAGEDLLEGSAKNPEQFDEPDDDALDEMAKLLGEDE
jgi:hypothetical protein